MKTIRLLHIEFDLPLNFNELPMFRAAIAHKVGLEHELFHHHTTNPQGERKLLYRYPFIQYKLIQKNATIVCLQEGIEEVYKVFAQDSMNIKLGQEEHKLHVKNMQLKEFKLHVSQENRHYHITNWLALNQKNYAQYQQTPQAIQRIAQLEKRLASHIIGFAKGVNWTIEDKFDLYINDYPKQFGRKHKGNSLTAFSVNFTSNIVLPSFIGLGKSPSRGFGTLYSGRNQVTTKQHEDTINQPNSSSPEKNIA